jgi:hypothetical protein
MSTPPPVTYPIVMPTVQDVGNLLRARTKTDTGAETGNFNDSTRPTSMAVTELIALAYGDVVSQVGDEFLADQIAVAAQTMVALRAAMFVELSYWPEQISTDRSPYAELKRLYDDGMIALGNAVSGEAPLEEPGGAGSYASLALVSSTTMDRS